MEPRQALEAKLQRRLRRHGWRLERHPAAEQNDVPSYRIVEEDDGSPIIGENFTLDLEEVVIWLE
jgi:hypothetical protein